jgi:hypothetical protein
VPRLFQLTLDCTSSTQSGEFDDYYHATTNNVRGVNPTGRAWWEEIASGWTPVISHTFEVKPPLSILTDPGNPEGFSPELAQADIVEVAIRDRNTAFLGAKIAVIFARNPKVKKKQAPVASPFRDGNFNRTTFIMDAVGISGVNQWFVARLPYGASYDRVGVVKGKATFTCFIGAVVDYGGGLVRQFGLDPDLEVVDYGGEIDKA